MSELEIILAALLVMQSLMWLISDVAESDLD